MPFPQPSEYDDAIQNPTTAFIDAELRNGVNDGPLRFGMPGPVASGNFAVVYRFRCGAKHYAVKCFTRQPPKDQEQRFISIHQHLRASHLSCATGFEFLPQGIRVRGTTYSLLKMEWLDAPTLLAFVPKNLHNREGFRQLSESFLSVCEELKKHRIAHGDLQHGNLLVLGGRLRIIDYDGMCVPGTAGLPSEEDGLPHYQHPSRRGGNLSPYFDHFPSLVIWTSLHALSVDPSLWARYVRDDERLLFSKDDFSSPQSSAIFRELLSYGDERLLKAVTALRDACALRDLAKIPALAEVVSSGSVVVDPEWWRTDKSSGPGKVAGATTAPHQPGRPDWMPSDQAVLLPARFKYSIIWDRLFSYAYAVMVIVASFSGIKGAISSDTLILIVGTLGGFLGARMFVSYMDSPAVLQKRRCAAKLRQAYSKLAEHETRLKYWKVEQESIIKQQRQPLNEQEAKLALLQAQGRQRQNEFDARLQRVLQALSTERQQTDARERQGLQAVSNEARPLETAHLEYLRRIVTEGSKMSADVTAQIDDLRREKEKKKDLRLKAMYDAAVQAELMRVPIRVTSVPSLTEANVRDLRDRGIWCAGDFTNWQATTLGTGSPVYLIVKADGSRAKIPGIGEKRANDLIEWREGLERRARGRLRLTLPPSVADEIEREAEQRRLKLARQASEVKAETNRLHVQAQEDYSKHKARLANSELLIRQTAAASREALVNRENQERQNADAQRTAVLAPINREIWQLQSVINPAKHKVDLLQSDYQRLLGEQNKEGHEMRSAAASVERELSQFQNIRVARYFARVFLFAGE